MIRRLALLAILVLAAIGCTVSAGDGGWKEYREQQAKAANSLVGKRIEHISYSIYRVTITTEDGGQIHIDGHKGVRSQFTPAEGN